MASKKLHKWAPEEDDLLIWCLVEIHKEGAFNRPLWKKQIEIRLNEKLPGCGIKASDIECHIKRLKQHWQMIYEMVYGPNNPGFKWDDNKKCVIAEEEVWDEYIKTNKMAVLAQSKSFPHFVALSKIFSRDETCNTESQVHCGVVYEFEVLYDELLKVDGIDDKERQDAYMVLVKDKALRSKFVNLPNDTKKDIVRELIS